MTAQQTQNICITFLQHRPNVFDVAQHCANGMQMSCVYWSIVKSTLNNIWDDERRLLQSVTLNNIRQGVGTTIKLINAYMTRRTCSSSSLLSHFFSPVNSMGNVLAVASQFLAPSKNMYLLIYSAHDTSLFLSCDVNSDNALLNIHLFLGLGSMPLGCTNTYNNICNPVHVKMPVLNFI